MASSKRPRYARWRLRSSAQDGQGVARAGALAAGGGSSGRGSAGGPLLLAGPSDPSTPPEPAHEDRDDGGRPSDATSGADADSGPSPLAASDESSADVDAPKATSPVADGDGAAHAPAHAEPAHAGHGPAEHAHAAEHDDHGLAHTTPVALLFAVLGALLVLTILTVSVTHFDLGSQGNLVVAMIIATLKAGLVVTFFMHLLWDKKFNLLLFFTSLLFVILFLSMTLTDRSEYQPNIDHFLSTPGSQ